MPPGGTDFAFVQTPAAERVHFNLWLADADGHYISSDPACRWNMPIRWQNGATQGIRVDILGSDLDGGAC